MTEYTHHIPVLLDECLEMLAPALQRPGAIYVDGTLGLAGHARAVLEAHPNASLIGIDRDPYARELAAEVLAPFGDRVTIVAGVFDELSSILERLNVDRVDGILLDLGVSSLQLDTAERGFSYAQDAPLDMRMDPTTGANAADVLATYDSRQLTRILRDFGDEKFARKIADAIVARQSTQPVSTSAELVDLIRQTLPQAAMRKGGHPAKRTFQALRIEVNRELEVLDSVLPQALDALAVGGRLAVMTFQSLEDRAVKRFCQLQTKSTSPADLPVELPEHAPIFTHLSKGGITPSAAEIDHNPRSTSVRLRGLERIAPGPCRDVPNSHATRRTS